MVKKEEKIKEKQYFTIKIEASMPVEITYRILAEDAEEALKLFETSPPTKNMVGQPRMFWNRMKNKFAKVYYWGMINLLKTKAY